MKIAGPLKDAATNIKHQLYRSNYHKTTGKATLESDNESLLAVTGRALSDGTNSRGHSQTQPQKGYLAVYVGPQLRRFVIPVSFLTMPEFRVLMERVGEEFGWEHDGGLEIPCDEEDFEQILMTCLSKTTTTKKLQRKIKF
ncbi:hypothetical protein L6164_004650 [Bauhinia variegata]|uniref:Uncharacterized protein n=1 Tax=Bauhinia variegata TaxID=167791 RepID=A0ACB9Q569_BAUVA|nr:hypothetical protein L6164_004650 [Bauhinia variegata]